MEISWQHVQEGSISKHLRVTKCTPTRNDALNCHHRLSALEGMVVQIADVMSRNYPKVRTKDIIKNGDVA